MTSTDGTSRPKGCTKAIGQIMIEKGLITEEQLQQALDLQEQEPSEMLGEILVRLGFATVRDIASAYAEQVLLQYGIEAEDDLNNSPIPSPSFEE